MHSEKTKCQTMKLHKLLFELKYWTFYLTTNISEISGSYLNLYGKAFYHECNVFNALLLYGNFLRCIDMSIESLT